jgi:hypothetical protein
MPALRDDIQKEYAQQRHLQNRLPFNHPGKARTDTEQIEQLVDAADARCETLIHGKKGELAPHD